jgi:hypothetical protein
MSSNINPNARHQSSEHQVRIIRFWLIVFIISLVLSGLTAFPLESELHWLLGVWPFQTNTPTHDWIVLVYKAISDSNKNYPFLAYGYDWLAFAHLVIAIAFVGPLRDPVKNIWIIEFGMIACVGVFPLAFIAGSIRSIPFYWRLIDCCFGFVGLVPLIIVYKKIRALESLSDRQK